jgi:hypothetical protein
MKNRSIIQVGNTLAILLPLGRERQQAATTD